MSDAAADCCWCWCSCCWCSRPFPLPDRPEASPCLAAAIVTTSTPACCNVVCTPEMCVFMASRICCCSVKDADWCVGCRSAGPDAAPDCEVTGSLLPSPRSCVCASCNVVVDSASAPMNWDDRRAQACPRARWSSAINCSALRVCKVKHGKANHDTAKVMRATEHHTHSKSAPAATVRLTPYPCVHGAGHHGLEGFACLVVQICCLCILLLVLKNRCLLAQGISSCCLGHFPFDDA